MGDNEELDWRKALSVVAAIVVLAVSVLAVMGTQVSGTLSTVGSSVGSPGGAGDSGDQGAGGEDAGSGAGSDGGTSGGTGSPAGVASLLDAANRELLIIKTGSIAIQAPDLDAALAEATARMTQLGGYASASERSGDGDDAHASTTYRIPAARWEEALDAVRGVGEKILDERSGTEDVTGQVVDLEARIRNLETTERALQSIMDRATAIKDVLDVQGELTAVRGEIEQLVSRSTDLRERAAMSTLTVAISVRPAPVVAQQEARFDAGTEVESATAQLVAILQGLATAGIWFAIVWLPILIALSLLGGAGWLVVRRVRRGAGDGGAPVATAAGGGA